MSDEECVDETEEVWVDDHTEDVSVGVGGASVSGNERVLTVMLLDSVWGNGGGVVLFGREEQGASVALMVEGWFPYLYVEAAEGCCVSLDAIAMALDAHFHSYLLREGVERLPKGKENLFVLRITEVMARNILGYPNELQKYWKVEVTHGRWLRYLKACVEASGLCGGCCFGPGHMKTFNATVDHLLQFMVDANMMGCQWCRVHVPLESFRVAHKTTDGFWTLLMEGCTRCDLEIGGLRVERDFELVESYALPPLRLLSFDIEAAGRRGVFPQASLDPVIQIAVHRRVVGSSDVFPPVLLSLRACDAVDAETEVWSFEDEKDLLLKFRSLVVDFDCDIFTGYNICNFDFLYLRDRAEALGCGDEFACMTRLERGKLYLRETVFESAQMGKRKRVRVTIPGRVCLDMLTCIQNNVSYKLERYTLNAVSEHFLGDHKVDLPFTQITPMWERDSAARRELGIYCLKDALLPLDLMEKLDSLMQTVEMARSTGIPFDWVLQRGIMVRNSSLLLRRAKARAYVFPSLHAPVKQRFEGATVLDAVGGIHQHVGVLDFSSMYPSIIRAHNLCYSTIILAGSPSCAYETIETRPGVMVRFVTEGVVKGLLPEVVEHLQVCRAKAKAAYAAATDPMQKRLSKARELAFKVAGNGMYGALGSEQSLLPLMAIAETVTAIGRRDIKCVKRMAETLYPDALVVYGDTDSVFVRFTVSEAARISVLESVCEASAKAQVLAAAVNEVMVKPKKIEFEKVYSTMLLLSKKRYAGVMYANGFKWGTDSASIDIKGMQCARRDGCPLVRNLVKECLVSILHTGDMVDAAGIVRVRLLQVLNDEVPLEDYAIQKVLRKTMQDCCLPMLPSELSAIRRQISMGDEHEGEPLSYAEQDEAIRRRVRLPWRTRVTLPHVMLAWRLRQKDPGNAPVLGESIRYVVTHNGGKQIWEKVESLEHACGLLHVDRQYYLDALRVPLDNIFFPICLQRLGPLVVDRVKRARAQASHLLWDCILGVPLRTTATKRRAMVEASPLARAFKRAAA